MKIRNKKGFVFTLDLILGFTIFFIALSISLFFVARGSQVSLSDYQLLVVGSDIVDLLDNKGAFDSLDEDVISNEMDSLIPASYDMLIRLQGDFSEGNGTIEIGSEIPSRRLLIAGQRVGVTSNSTYFKVTYFTWPRLQE
mgnify:CR=1 FL=1|jgi:hypothetical protein